MNMRIFAALVSACLLVHTANADQAYLPVKKVLLSASGDFFVPGLHDDGGSVVELVFQNGQLIGRSSQSPFDPSPEVTLNKDLQTVCSLTVRYLGSAFQDAVEGRGYPSLSFVQDTPFEGELTEALSEQRFLKGGIPVGGSLNIQYNFNRDQNGIARGVPLRRANSPDVIALLLALTCRVEMESASEVDLATAVDHAFAGKLRLIQQSSSN